MELNYFPNKTKTFLVFFTVWTVQKHVAETRGAAAGIRPGRPARARAHEKETNTSLTYQFPQ